MINFNIIKTIMTFEAKWKLKQLPTIILAALCGYVLLFFVFSDDVKEFNTFLLLYGFLICAYISHSSILPVVNISYSNKNYSLNYLQSIARDKTSFILGIILTGLIRKLPLIAISIYALISYGKVHFNFIYFLIIGILCSICLDLHAVRATLNSRRRSVQSFSSNELINKLGRLIINSLKSINLVSILGLFSYAFLYIYRVFSPNTGYLFICISQIILVLAMYSGLLKMWFDERESKISFKEEFICFGFIIILTIITVIMASLVE